ncbi:MAG TPA: GTP-binding protein [Candidatus Dojkabacteria bacterium]|mgnify:CR=1 FL=1|nr:GTP-binding protein [Candidatus Dojkabacteria bacterium]
MDNIHINKENIRNIAIIAHVDHGKTTLVDAFMKQTHLFRENEDEMSQTQILDSGDLEKEKGITIKAKNISVRYKGYKINIIDTPGHSDFGGEVERTLNMADSCLLLVDAQEGVMPQTKFVLKKALEIGLKPIVVVNKIDKKLANVKKTLEKVQDLFLTLATDMEQLDFPVFYAIAREGKVFKELPQDLLTAQGDISLLLDEIIEYAPAPQGSETEPFQMQITSLEYDAHLGRYLIGKINRGEVKRNDPVILLDKENKIQGRVRELFVKEGLQWVSIDSAQAGEIVAIAGIDSTAIGATLCALDTPQPLENIHITPPAVKVRFEANTSPLSGKEGKFVTAKQLEQRLEQEKDLNISLQISKVSGSSYSVAGRGELQLAILVEQLRREGYEFQLGKPEVVLIEKDGKQFEPIEELVIDCPTEYLSIVTEEVSGRKGELVNIESEGLQTRFTYRILTRNLIGLHRVLMNATKGTAVTNSFVIDYVPYIPQPPLFRKGVIISQDSGTTLGFSLTTIQDRGQLFVGPSEQVYEGMIIGINNHEQDLVVNPCKARHKTNVRMLRSELTLVNLKPTVQLTIEYALSFINEDELIEITPKNIRLRKKLLTETERVWSKRKNLTAYAKQQMGIED